MTWITMEERVARTDKLVSNLIDDVELKAAGKTIGIDDVALARGVQLVKAARAADEAQRAADGAWADLRAERKQLRDAITQTYIQHRRVARLSIEIASIRTVLDIARDREKGVVGLHAQMLTFYTVGLSNAAALAELNRIGITRAMLESGRTTLEQITTLLHQETHAKATKEEATDARDAALDAMDAWYAQTVEGMAYATREKPTLLKRLGV